MNRGDISVIFPSVSALYAPKYVVASGTVTSINAGEPVKSTTVGQAVAGATGDGTTSQKIVGISKTDSTDTASVNGVVYVFLAYMNIVFSAKAKVAANANTQALIDALAFKRVKFDLTAGKFTVDTAQSNATTNGIVIVGGDPVTSSIYFTISPQCTVFDNPTTA